MVEQLKEKEQKKKTKHENDKENLITLGKLPDNKTIANQTPMILLF